LINPVVHGTKKSNTCVTFISKSIYLKNRLHREIPKEEWREKESSFLPEERVSKKNESLFINLFIILGMRNHFYGVG
jgi:hypothetical protein